MLSKRQDNTTLARRRRYRDWLYSIVGTKCWLCGYGGSEQHIAILDFHHMDPSQKVAGISIIRSHYGIEKMVNEVIKCALLCPRCHKELHAGIISEKEVRKAYKKEWKSRRKHLDKWRDLLDGRQ